MVAALVTPEAASMASLTNGKLASSCYLWTVTETESHVLQGDRQGVHGCEQDQRVHSGQDGVLPHAGNSQLPL